MNEPAAPEGAKDENTREILQAIGRLIDESLPQGWGFFLMSFPFNDAPGRMNYVANAKREDVLKLMHEFITKEEKTAGYGQHLKDLHVWADLTKEDLQFLIWALGFVEGRAAEMPLLSVERRAEIMHQCKEIWPKLSGLL